MENLLDQWFAQAPTVVVLIYVFSQMKVEVHDLIVAILRLLEMCMGDKDRDSKGMKGNNGPD